MGRNKGGGAKITQCVYKKNKFLCEPAVIFDAKHPFSLKA
jgi:hypothetical protein